jgi:capsule biosynthesis phosphatase
VPRPRKLPPPPARTVVCDLDGTICEPKLFFKDTNRRYAEATPIDRTIKYLRRCRDVGVVIVIHTARRMLTHGGDVKKIEKDVGDVTREWLRVNGVPYDELVFGKPYGDLYIDDKACFPDDLPEL